MTSPLACLQLSNHYQCFLSRLCLFTRTSQTPEIRRQPDKFLSYQVDALHPHAKHWVWRIRWASRLTSLIFRKETGDCTGLERVDQTISTSKKEESAKHFQATTSNSSTDSTHVHRQLTTEYPSFLGLPSAKLLDCQTGQTTLWVFLLGFSYPRSRTGLCAWITILLFPHHGSLFHTTMLYLPYLFRHVSRIRNHLHGVELRKPIGWHHDSDPNVNGECRKSHSASCPLDTKYGSHASQPEPPASHTNPSTLFHLHLNTNLYHYHLHSHWPRIMWHPCPLLHASENQRLQLPSPFLEKGTTPNLSSTDAAYIWMAENQNSQTRMPRSTGSFHICRLVLPRHGVTTSSH